MSVLKVDSQNFQSEILDFQGIALVDFYADWCGPCRMLAPELDMLSEELKNNPSFKFAKLDTDANIDLARQYRISSIPNVIIFKNGKVINQVIGLPQGPNGEMPRSVFKKLLLEESLK